MWRGLLSRAQSRVLFPFRALLGSLRQAQGGLFDSVRTPLRMTWLLLFDFQSGKQGM
jgi:hypothetical protein